MDEDVFVRLTWKEENGWPEPAKNLAEPAPHGWFADRGICSTTSPTLPATPAQVS